MLILLRSNPKSVNRLQSFFKCHRSIVESSKSTEDQIGEPSGAFAVAVLDTFEIRGVDDNLIE